VRSLIVVAFLALPFSATIADEKANLARVVMSGKATSFIQASSVRAEISAGDDVQKKLREALKQVTATTFKVGEKAGVVVVLPANTFKLEDAVDLINAAVAVEGILSSTDDAVLIAVAGATGERRVPLLIANKAVRLDETNKDRYPTENHAIIEGGIDKAEIKVGEETFRWAIQNADGRIPLTFPKDGKSPEQGTKQRATGKVRIATGRLILDASKVEPVTK
jgi:hypothetical protein